ncbi:MAG TPA: hypothetical protein VFU60_15030 [Ktedonobacterales bacterium]|jgi:hypothetical protein|nr:hypothetical protein [Ktedonobacterales bacterium]
MSERQRARFLWLMGAVVGANYLAQIPYYLHLYYFPHGALPSARGVALLGFTLIWFMAGIAGLALRRAPGYWLLGAYLVTVVIFYLHGLITQVTHGYPPTLFIHLNDPILTVVFAIGYCNMLLGALFIVILARHYRALVASPPAARTRPSEA